MKLLSILIPTRGRPEQLGKCIASLNTMAHTPANIEILLGIDSDCRVEEYPFSEIEIIPIVAERPRGQYQEIHVWYNRLYEASVGEWLWVMNDDCCILTSGYDTTIANMPSNKILRNEVDFVEWRKNVVERHPGNMFPIIHRNIADEKKSIGSCFEIDTEYERITTNHPELLENTNILITHGY